MRYKGFETRDRLILNNLPIKKKLSYLEIGPGISGVVDFITKKGKRYFGVDISLELVEYLKKFYEKKDKANFSCIDVCNNLADLNETFDVIFSTDTLEHVESAPNFFKFVNRHLKNEGFILIIFPNESAKKHHGILWFEDKKSFIKVLDESGLKIDCLLEIKETLWHKGIRYLFWDFPKNIFLKKKKEKPQRFDETHAFSVVKEKNLATKILTIYSTVVSYLANLLPLYRFLEIEEDITNKYLLIKLKKITK